ncbi:nucleoid occlusion factor SlmA [Burkholderia gladioli]|uniref:nucleoid occlusion factor SlmA n=1 Tax=Burkholderia gladioli TaxID=28095 RepID=UPI0006494C70|nr:nucleoid occlusion factor SlmA [Burkholderia gladioli]MDA0576185.1 nucleoid occlusion factor SlmA [Burkholderia gladioli]MDA0604279.1 nucleoid occlusion factor SlmA [Burkholderia gladioli]
MQPTEPRHAALNDDETTADGSPGTTGATAPRGRTRPRPGERRVLILQTLAAMLEAPKREKITTAALAARLEISEAALYRHFASKAQMFEGLIEFIETTIFGLINQILEKEPDGVLQARAIGLMLLNFAARNPGMTRVLTGEALVGEHERLGERVDRMLERVEASVRQCLRLALAARDDGNGEQPTRGAAGAAGEAGAPLQPAGYDPALRANLLVTHVLGRWHRYARSGFTKSPAEQADVQLQLILR